MTHHRTCPHGVVSGQCMSCLAETVHAEAALLTDLRQAAPTVPPRVLARVQHALVTLRAWNAALLQARAMEAVAHQPGRYEYDLRYSDDAGLDQQRTWTVEAWLFLEQFEVLAAMHGVDPEAVYTTYGGKPALLVAEGPQVQDWRVSR